VDSGSLCDLQFKWLGRVENAIVLIKTTATQSVWNYYTA